MNPPEIEDRYVHEEGLTVAKYIQKGGEIVTGGSDSTVKVFFAAKDERNLTSKFLDKHIEGVTTIATHGDIFATAGEDGYVVLYKKDNEADKVLLRSLVPVRCIRFDPTGRKLAIAADENIIRVVLIADVSKVVILKGHTSKVKSLDFEKSGRYLISSSCDGDVRVWDIGPTVAQPTCVKVMKGVTKSSLPESELLGTVAWNPNGSCFAVPGTGPDVRVFAKDIWTPFYTLENGHIEPVVTLAWSPNGYYLASAGSDKQLIIWDASKKSIVAKHMIVAQISSIDWHPKENKLIFTDRTGQLFYWDDVIPNSSKYPHPALTKEKPSTNASASSSSKDQISTLFGDDDDELSTPDVSGSQMLRQMLAKGGSTLDDEALETNGSDEEGEDVGESLHGEDDDDDMMDDDLNDFVIDDDGAGYAENSEEARRELTRSNHSASQKQPNAKVRLDPIAPFQPGETPFNKPIGNIPAPPSDGDRRYLAFNLVGAIYTIYQSDHSIVNVEFHDQTENRNFHFTDYSHLKLGAIGTQGTVFACGSRKTVKERANDILDDVDDEQEEEEITIGSTLYYRPLNTWASNTEWTHYMPIGEEITNVAINATSVIVATSAGYIRVFSLSGLQKHIFSLSNVVTMNATADLAIIVYSANPSFSNQQNLNYMLINTESNDILQDKKIQLSPDSKLTWVGFSETSQAVIYDSQFVLRVLHRQRRPNQGAWVPVFDGVKHAQEVQRTERYWPVGLLNDKLLCIIVRGSNEYPFFPRPNISDIALEMPVVKTDPQTAKLEEQYIRELTITLHERDEAEATQQEEKYQDEFSRADIEIDKTLLLLIQQACKNDKPARALDLTNALHMSRSVDAAIKVAMYHRLSSLADKMSRIKEMRFMGQEEVRRHTLAESLETQPSIYNSDEPSMSSNLAFVDRPSSFDTSFISRKRDTTDDFDEDSDMMQTSELSPQPKRTRPFQFN